MRYKRLSNAYLSAFCLELHMLLAAGIALPEGIQMLLDDETEKEGQKMLQGLTTYMDNHASLSESLRESGYFPAYLVGMTEAGEQTGHLAESLKALSAHYDRQDRLAVSIKNAALYPSLLLIMMVAVIIVLIVKVLPIFNDIFNRLGSRMSPLAINLMQFGHWLRSVSEILAVLTAAVFILVFLIWLLPPVRQAVFTVCKNFIGHRSVFGRVATARFTSVMAMAVSSGMETESMITLASSVSGHSNKANDKCAKCLDLLRSGDTLADALYGAGIITARDLRMLSLGSRSGMTDTAMAEIANRSERAVQDEIDRLVSMVEPVIVVITSVMVGIILFSVMLPLMSIMTSIG